MISIVVMKIDNPMFHDVDFSQTEIVMKIVRVRAWLIQRTLLHSVDRSNSNHNDFKIQTISVSEHTLLVLKLKSSRF